MLVAGVEGGETPSGIDVEHREATRRRILLQHLADDHLSATAADRLEDTIRPVEDAALP